MRRKVPGSSRPQTGASVSLFPFLAVLVCTMGALIVLLMVITRQARRQVQQVAAAKVAQQQADLESERETVQWRIEQLTTSRQKTESQLAEARLQLGHVEDHARRLQEQLARLEAAWTDLQRPGTNGRQRDQQEADLAGLKAAIEEARKQLAQARTAAQQHRRSYAVIPYEGPNATRRRPIYIECLEDAIILQPEGVVLTLGDLEGPPGPGNPLAAALRATREYQLAHGGTDPQESAEPYPLLLVRARGIETYYAAREAMKSWGSEFGYELIGEDWQLQFGPSDPALADVLRKTVRTARARQQELIAAAPRSYAAPRPQKFRAAPARGGVVRDDGSAWSVGGGDPTQRRETSAPGSGGPEGGGLQARQPSGPIGSPYSPPSTSSGSKPALPEGRIAGQAPSERAPSSSADHTEVLRPGQWEPGAALSGKQMADAHSGNQSRKLAETRGRDWALRDAARGAVPITRPIRVECYADRLQLSPERQMPGGKSIPLGQRTEEAIEALVSAVWEYMESWGIAGRGMYWRPVLNIHVFPGAEQHYAELETLLDGSGLVVQRRQD